MFGYYFLQVSKETGEASVAVQEEASAILEEMAHRLQLGTVRFFAFTLAKAFKTLFRSICVNEEGIQRVSSIQARLKSCISSPDRMDTGIQTTIRWRHMLICENAFSCNSCHGGARLMPNRYNLDLIRILHP